MKPKRTGTLTGFVVAVVLLGGLLLFRSSSVEAVYPFERAFAAFRGKVWIRVKGIFTSAEVAAENRRLKREVESLSLELTELERIAGENARLRRTLGYRDRERGNWLAAEILSACGAAASVHPILRVDKGLLDGVRDGAIVAVHDGLVGRIVRVTPHTAEVMPIYDRSVKIACEIESPGERVRGIVCGGDEESLSVRYLTCGGSDIAPRSRVVTSGLGGVFPKGYAVGTYVGDGKVQPSVDFSSLEDVFIRRAK